MKKALLTHNQERRQGFIALIGAIIISVILLSLSLSSSAQEFSARFDALDTDSKHASETLANSCTQVALLRIGQNYSYTPEVAGDEVTVGNTSCTIVSVTYSAEDTVHHQKTATVHTRGTARNTWTTRETNAVILNPAFAHSPTEQNITLTSSEEI